MREMTQAIDEELIRMRSYIIWENEGRPEGRDLDHWSQAARELEAESAETAPPSRPKRGKGAKTAPAAD
jgi:hypothetical protein